MSNNNGWNKPKTIKKGKNKFQGKNKWYEEQKKTVKMPRKEKVASLEVFKKINRPLTQQMKQKIKSYNAKHRP